MLDDFGRYNKSGEQSNMISTWSGVPITYNRKTAGIMCITNPCISICGSIQPGLLPDFAADSRQENGFLSRFCTVFPDNTKKARYSTQTIHEEIINGWEEFLSKLVNLDVPIKIRLSKKAEEKYEQWYNKNAEIADAEKSEYLKGVYGKLDIISLRTAIVVKGMNIACGINDLPEITADEMETALGITEYFRETAKKVFEGIYAKKSSYKFDQRSVVVNYLKKQTNMNISQIASTLGIARNQVYRELNKV